MSARTGARPRRTLAVALVGAALTLRAGPALAHSGAPDEGKPVAAGSATAPDPVGEASGLRVLARLAIPHARDEVNSDLWKLGDTVLVGYRCGGDGSALIDVADPEQPRIVARTVALPGSFANDVKAIRLDGPAYTGDLFIEPHDTCTTSTVSAQTRLWAIDDPARPELLASLETVNGVHNVYPFHRDGRDYLLMALPTGDTATSGVRAGFAIAEITDPRNPTIVGTYNLRDDLGDVPGNDFLHDAWASADGRTAYLSWWDAGMIVMDLTDLAHPEPIQRLVYYGQPDWYGPAAGNTHSAVPMADGRHVVVTDEDFSVGEFSFEITAPASEQGSITASQDDFLAPILGGGHAGTVAAALATAPDACAERADGLRDRVALLDRSPRCTPVEQVAAAQEAGALAVVLVNADGGDEGRLEGWHRGLKIPAVQVSRATGARLKTAVRSHPEVQVRLAAVADAWGFARIADLAAPGGPRIISNLKTANTDRFPPKDKGWYSVHNPMVVGDTLYLSHYADGVRVWDISDPVDPFETAYFVPPDLPDDAGRPLQGQIWGVYPEEGLVYASDIAHGLWVLARTDLVTVPTPPPAPSEDPTLAPTPTPTDTPTPEPTATPKPTEAPPITALPGPAVVTPTLLPTATVEPTSTTAPDATATRAPTSGVGARRPAVSRLHLPLAMKPRRRG